MTQRDLAKATGLTQPAVGRLEVGEHTPSLRTLAKLSRATGLVLNLSEAGGGVGLAA